MLFYANTQLYRLVYIKTLKCTIHGIVHSLLFRTLHSLSSKNCYHSGGDAHNKQNHKQSTHNPCNCPTTEASRSTRLCVCLYGGRLTERENRMIIMKYNYYNIIIMLYRYIDWMFTNIFCAHKQRAEFMRNYQHCRLCLSCYNCIALVYIVKLLAPYIYNVMSLSLPQYL